VSLREWLSVRASVLGAAAALLLTAPLAACGGTEENASGGSSTVEPATTTVVVTDTITQPSPKPKPPLEDGHHFGYIKAAQLTDDPRELVFDLAYFLTGDEANAAAEERGFQTPVDNDYFIVNDNKKLRMLPVAEDVAIDLLDWTHCCETRFAGDPAKFEASFEATEPPSGKYHGAFSAYWLVIEGSKVVSIEEQYLP
jgi:hypothetical protein